MSNYTYSHFVKLLYDGDKAGVSVFPNPAIESITLDISSYENDMVNIEVTDSSGDAVKMDNVFVRKGNTSLSVNINHLSKGMFAINIASSNQIPVSKAAG